MKALLLVDIQNDFLPGGALAVPAGEQVIPVANRLIQQFRSAGDLVVATQDWHPPGHSSFASQHEGHEPGEVIELDGLEQILWPDHCVQHTPGAAFPDDLAIDKADKIIPKGTDPAIDSYSGFFDNGHRKDTGLDDWLKQRGIHDLTIVGLATDYCVKFTVLDALELGYRVTVVTDGIRAVNLKPGDGKAAIEEMKNAGANIT